MKKIIMAIMAMVMVFAMVGCGGDGNSGTEATTSQNGIISVVLPDGFEDTNESDSYEMLFIQPEGAESQSYNYIEIVAPDTLGVMDSFDFYWTAESNPYQFVKGEAYTMDMLKADAEIYVGQSSGIYSNLQEVTIGDYDYMRCECVTNGENAYRYYTVVNERPCTVTVVGGDLLDRDSDEVKAIMEAITFNPAW